MPPLLKNLNFRSLQIEYFIKNLLYITTGMSINVQYKNYKIVNMM